MGGRFAIERGINTLAVTATENAAVARLRSTAIARLAARWPAAVLAVLLLVTSAGMPRAWAQPNDPKNDRSDTVPANAPHVPSEESPQQSGARQFEVQAADGSTLVVQLHASTIRLDTGFGTLAIPVARIRRIDFATRLPGALVKRIEAAIEKLADDRYRVREDASEELLSLKAAAYPALLEAATSDDAEVARRAQGLMEQIRQVVPEKELSVRDQDTVYTDGSKIAGKIELNALDVDMALFGRQQLGLDSLRSLAVRPGDLKITGPILPDPGTLGEYRDQVGQTFFFRVTAPAAGVQKGMVWGTEVYSHDSSLAMAALHAGVMAAGETKVVGVKVLGPQKSFDGSLRNGILSQKWGEYPSAFRFITEPLPEAADVDRPE